MRLLVAFLFVCVALLPFCIAVAATPPDGGQAQLLTLISYGSDEAPLRVMVVCGLHPREVLSTALCLRWATLLAAQPDQGTRTQLLLATVRHSGPAAQLDHYPCWRGNWRGVDLNRNWPRVPGCVAHPPADPPPPPDGPEPLSEPESRALDDAITAFAPDVLLAVHSGTNAMLTPYDSCERTPQNWPDLLRLGRWLVSDGVCPHCLIDTTPQALGYTAGGTLTDYAYHWLGVPLVLTVELYENAEAVQALARAGALSPSLCSAMFVPVDMDAVLAPWDTVLWRLARPSDADYVELCRMANIVAT